MLRSTPKQDVVGWTKWSWWSGGPAKNFDMARLLAKPVAIRRCLN